MICSDFHYGSNQCAHLIPKGISDTIPSMTANSLVNMNLPIEYVISEKPNRDSLEPIAPVKMTFGFVNLLFTLILFHNDFEMQLRDASESTLVIKL